MILWMKRKKQETLSKHKPLPQSLGSFSSLGGLLAGNGPIQWALATIMVLVACAGLFCVAKRFQEHRL